MRWLLSRFGQRAGPESPTRGACLLLLACLLSGCYGTPQAAMPARQLSGRPRVACVGDSITAGAGLADPGTSAYPAVLGQLLGSAYEVRNYGVSGSTLSRDGDRPYVETPQYEAARESLPQVVIIALGTNDSKPQNWRYQNTFERDLYSMVRSFLTLPSHPVVYVCTPPPVFRNRWGITSNVVDREIAPRIRRVAIREGWPVIDLNQALRGAGHHFPDGIHPSAAGAASLASSVEMALRGR